MMDSHLSAGSAPETVERRPVVVEEGALAEWLRSGMCVALGGLATSCHAMVAVRHMIRRGLRDLTVIGSASRVEDIREAFQSTYLRRYGFVETDAPLEFVSLVLTARVRMDRPALASMADLARPVTSAKTRRSVYFSECRSRLDTPVYQRSSLPVGFAMNGPALIEEYGSTTVVGPRDRFEIGRLGEIRIRFN